MNVLFLIWAASIVMAAAAVVWMIELIAARAVRERAEAKRLRDRRLIQDAFLDIMKGSGEALGRLRSVRGRARLMAESVLEVLALVRGAERERLISALAAARIDETFRRRLFRGSFAGRIAAAEALAIFPGEGAVAGLRQALARARAVELRVSIMNSLIDMGSPPALGEVLADLAGRRTSESLLYLPLIGRLTREDPQAALDAFGDPRAAGEVRVVLAEALAASGEFRALDPLCAAARSPDIELRIAAVRALGALGHPIVEATIMEALADPVWMVRAAACEAAGRIGLAAAVPTLAGQLEDEVWWVRFRAGEALAALGEAGRDRLRLVAATGEDLARRTASMVLAERGLAVAA